MSQTAKTWGRSIVEHKWGRYGMAPVLLGLGLALSQALHPILPYGEQYILIAAVVATAWLGGWRPGLVAAMLAPFVFDYFYLSPFHTLGISAEARPYILPFLLSAVAGAWAGSSRAATRHAHDLLKQSEAKFRRILSNLPDIAWTVDAKGRVVYISPRAETVLGWTKKEICAGGITFFEDRIHPEELGRVQNALRDLFLPGRSFDEEFRWRRRDGSWIWLQSRAVSYQLNGSAFADGVLSDISRRKQAEVELQEKTAFLEAQTNATIDGLLVVDANGKRILQNRRFNEIFAVPRKLFDDAEDAPVLDHVVRQAKDPAAFLERVLYLYTHPEATSRDEIELVNGTFLDRYSTAVYGTGGHYYGRIWTFRDITERRRNEDQLRQLSAAVEQSPVSVVITDAKGDISYVNRKFTELTGYSAAEVLGKNPKILKSGYSPPEVYANLWETLCDGREWRGEFHNRRKDGQLFWEAATLSPILDADGKICHFLAVKEDITKRRALEAELRQAQKLEAIGQLAAGIAHEINTPIQFVSDNLTFLQEACSSVFPMLESSMTALRAVSSEAAAELDASAARCDLAFLREEVPRALDQSLDGTRRVATIVRAMKEFSHPDLTGKRRFDLHQGIESTITISRNEWKYVAEMATDFDPGLPPVVCYPGDINQVVLNLIVNAAWAIRDRAEKPGKGQITVRTRRRGELAEIAVSDTGVGIPEEIQGRIFEPFFTTREVGSGTGQGLALAHSVIVRKHGGKIWFETEAGRGTTFFVQLPIDAGREQEDA
ncbi:MAG TPA: PAS domain S-box protein [Acidobacteriaceae bacterium]|jgi:PAS domain S-box-containing protein|nr:PAS domain S-box protein [Acidobacteriaceae bacterium]